MRRTESDNPADPREAGWMRRAIANAIDTRPHPNPRVGAVVITSDGSVASEAAHAGPGLAHAEAAAVAAAGDQARRATVVVTLEPCDHQGRTSPCTEALIAAGVSRVVIGAVDPDARVAGRGIDRLRRAGVEVVTGVCADEVEALDPSYFHHRRTGRSRVTLKSAVTLDGQAAAADGTSQWITSEAARRNGHELRAEADAVIVGAGTLRADDPALTARIPDVEAQPRPVIVAGHRPLPDVAQVYARDPLVYAPAEPVGLPSAIERTILWSDDGVDLEAMVKDLAERGYLEVLVEGGPTLAARLVAAGVVDRLVMYLGGVVAGGVGIPMLAGRFPTLAAARHARIVSAERLGPDLRIEAQLAGGT